MVEGQKIIREPGKGLFARGHSGNPGGMPAGTISIVRLINKHLGEHPRDADAVVDALIRLAKRGEMRAIELLIERVDGKVIEKHLIESELPVQILFVPAQRVEEGSSIRTGSAQNVLELKSAERLIDKVGVEGDSGGVEEGIAN